MQKADDVSSLEDKVLVRLWRVGADNDKEGLANGERHLMGARLLPACERMLAITDVAGQHLGALKVDLIGEAHRLTLSTHLEAGSQLEVAFCTEKRERERRNKRDNDETKGKDLMSFSASWALTLCIVRGEFD